MERCVENDGGVGVFKEMEYNNIDGHKPEEMAITQTPIPFIY